MGAARDRGSGQHSPCIQDSPLKSYLKQLTNPHYSCAILLQSPIRCCDEPSASGLAHGTLTVLHEYASGPYGSARWSRDAAQRFRDEPS